MAEGLPNEDQRPVALLFYRYFSAQFDATGPTQSLCRMVDALGHRFRFRAVSIAMPGEDECRWGEVFGIERIGIATGLRGIIQQWRLIRTTRFDLAIHNSFFDPQLTIATLLMRKLGLIPRRPTLVAPRGEFSPGALALKPGRKQLYLKIVRWLGLVDDIHVQATGSIEADAIRAVLPKARSILIGPNIRSLEPLPPHPPRAPGEPLRIAFLSRIDGKKNLHGALKFLSATGAKVAFDIIGPVHDPNYWSQCRTLIATMPPHVAVRHLGPAPAAEVVKTLARYDLMLFPTAGENYGHVIVESFLAGTPVLVSDQTPWLGLAAARAGADLPLEDEQAWRDWISRFAAMTDEELEPWRAGARAYAERALSTERDTQMVADCLTEAIGGTRRC